MDGGLIFDPDSGIVGSGASANAGSGNNGTTGGRASSNPSQCACRTPGHVRGLSWPAIGLALGAIAIARTRRQSRPALSSRASR
jgi:hypothetical protein